MKFVLYVLYYVGLKNECQVTVEQSIVNIMSKSEIDAKTNFQCLKNLKDYSDKF